MSPCLLGCVVFCLLQAGAVHAGVSQDPRLQVVRTGQRETVTCTQDLGHNSVYWYRLDPGHGLRLIHYSAAYPSTEKGDVPRGLQHLQTKHRGLPFHAEVCQPLPDICVLLCQQLLQGAARPPPFCAKKQM
ncbi:hypothetical protein CapIbe_003508, partial [Capra ibex]